MKIRILIVVAIVSVFISACSVFQTDLDGTFYLVRVSGGVLPGNPAEFDLGDVAWTFDSEMNTLTVVQNNTSSGLFIPSGTYGIELNGDDLMLTEINQPVSPLIQNGRINSLSNRDLVIDFGLALDGVVCEFMR